MMKVLATLMNIRKVQEVSTRASHPEYRQIIRCTAVALNLYYTSALKKSKKCRVYLREHILENFFMKETHKR